jgi:hypothetical protein
MSHSLMGHTACPGLELLSSKCLATTAGADAEVYY